MAKGGETAEEDGGLALQPAELLVLTVDAGDGQEARRGLTERIQNVPLGWGVETASDGCRCDAESALALPFAFKPHQGMESAGSHVLGLTWGQEVKLRAKPFPIENEENRRQGRRNGLHP